MVACLDGCAKRLPDLPDGSVIAVDIELDNWEDRQKAAKVASTDAAKIDALLAVLRSAETTGDHKCGDSGRITLHRKDGSEVKLGILPGHHAEYYEFRVYEGNSYGIFRVLRPAFLQAVLAFGVGPLDLGFPE